VRQIKPFTGKIGNRLVALAILAALAAILFVYQSASSFAVLKAQTRAQQRRNRPRPKRTQTRVNKVPAFIAFKHESHREPKAKLKCANCHFISSLEAPDEIVAVTKPSIKGFPYHDSCLECHRLTPPQFFRGSSPVVCGVCHTRSSPRLTAKEMFSFPKPDNVRTHELVGHFSHGSREHRNATRNCSTCHLKDQRAAIAIAATGGDKDYVPAEGTFKTLPFGHASCFANCHWDKDEPTKEQCAGCHFTQEVLATKKHNLLSPVTAQLFKDWPRAWPDRLSLKFSHESKNHREAENPELVCTKCHDKIRKAEPLENPDVKITACADSGCHFERASRTSIRKEMVAENEDIAEGRNNDPSSRSGQNTCLGCHVKAIGSLPPPCSHYQLFEAKYFKVTDYPHSAQQLSKQCPQ
jgi:hypothetical protein